MGFIHLNKPYENSALTTILENYSIIGPERHQLAQNIIFKYSSSTDPLDKLAVAIAFQWKGANHRPSAIKFYEEYLSSGTNTDLIDTWIIYSDLATLYEKEYEFEKALEYLEKLIIYHNDYIAYIRIGDIYIKQDVSKAISYYEKLLKEPFYKDNKHMFDCAYAATKEKQARGYVYKPRKRS